MKMYTTFTFIAPHNGGTQFGFRPRNMYLCELSFRVERKHVWGHKIIIRKQTLLMLRKRLGQSRLQVRLGNEEHARIFVEGRQLFNH